MPQSNQSCSLIGSGAGNGISGSLGYMKPFHFAAALIAALSLSACQTSDALNSVAVNQPQVQQSQALTTAQIPVPLQAPERSMVQGEAVATHGSEPASTEMALLPLAFPESSMQAGETQMASLNLNPEFEPIVEPRTSKTYLINGLLSAVPFIGYGFRNLHKKNATSPNSLLYIAD